MSTQKAVPPRKRPKVQITIRIDADVLDEYRAMGPGYQRAMEAALISALGRNRRQPGGRRAPEWTEDEDAYVREQYPDHGAQWVAAQLERTIAAVQQRANYLRVRRNAL